MARMIILLLLIIIGPIPSVLQACDDQNTLDDDGCTSDCTAVEAGYECTPTSGKGMLGSMADVCTKVCST